MRILSLVFLTLAASFAMRAQTNTVTPAVGTNVAPAAAQSNAPTEMRATDIYSERSELFLRSNVVVYRDNVRVDNPQMKLRCELLTVEAPKMTNENRFNRATAETNVVIDWMDNNGTNHATSDKAVYTYVITNLADGQMQPHFETSAIVVLTGNPIVTNRSYRFEGDPIVWDRINDVITNGNMKRTTIYQNETNSSSLFEQPTSKPAKTNTPAK